MKRVSSLFASPSVALQLTICIVAANIFVASTLHGGSKNGKHLALQAGDSHAFTYEYFSLTTRGADLYQRELSYRIDLQVLKKKKKSKTAAFECDFRISDFFSNDDDDKDGLLFPLHGSVVLAADGSLQSANISAYNRPLTAEEKQQIKQYRLSDTYLFKTYLRFTMPTVRTAMNIGDKDTNTVQDTSARQERHNLTLAERLNDTTLDGHTAEMYSVITSKNELQKASRDAFQRRAGETTEGQEMIWWSENLALPVKYVNSTFTSRRIAVIEQRRRTGIYGNTTEELVSLHYLGKGNIAEKETHSHVHSNKDENESEDSLMEMIPTMEDK
jgi:hypothetical protein